MRIAALQPSVSIMLKALDSLDSICACTKYCVEAIPELASMGVLVLHDSWSADASEIVAAAPNLVIASVPYRMESLAAILKAGLPVLALAPHSLADIYADLRLVASIVNAHDAGEAVIRTMQQAIGVARAATEQASRPLVYCEEWGKPLIHSQPWVAELIEAAGGRFFGKPGAHTTSEEIASATPDVIIFAWCGAGARVPLAKVVNQRKWQNMGAVTNGRVHCIPDEFLNTPAPTLLDGLACLRGIIHPELFAADPRVVSLAPSG